MDLIILMSIIIILSVLIYLAFEILRVKHDQQRAIEEAKAQKEEVAKLNQSVLQHLNASFQANQSLSHNLGQLLQKLEEVRNVAQAAQDLKNLLAAPKGRGKFGEVSLYSLVRDIFPSDIISEQYSFRNGQRADLALRIGDRLLIIDSKFPVSDFAGYYQADEAEKRSVAKQIVKNVRNHVNSISEKYINPNEGTFDFAFMYVPSESLYYEICANPDFQSEELLEYARQKRVYMVSPNTLHAYLGAIAYAVRASTFEKNVGNALDALTEVISASKSVVEEFNVLSRHISNASLSANRLNQRLTEQAMKLELLNKALESFSSEGDGDKGNFS